MKSKIRNYEIQSRLGSGSFGVIFKAINKSDKSQCVLKQIRMSKMSEKSKKSTLNEATIMGKLIYPFIVQYKQSFVEDDTLHIIMQYCDNGDLSMFLKAQNKKPLKQEKIWKFFIQICLGLEYIHRNKILHRDIKSLNIFLNKNQDVKIGDLGVAKMLMANDFAQTVVGTPFYLSPELCQQKPYNQKSDIWALGCLLYELCTFKHPFQAANQASLVLKIIRGKYSPIPQFYSKELKDVIDACLQRDYKRRPTANMILQRSKIRQYMKQFKIEEKIKEEYDKIKANKENNHLKQMQSVDATKFQNLKLIQKPINSHENNTPEIKKLINQAKPSNPQYPLKKYSVDKKEPILQDRKPSVSGMPEENIILPDKNYIIEKLKQGNTPLISQKKQAKPPLPLVKHQSNRKAQQNKQQFLKNLQKVIDQNFQQKKSPFKDKIKIEEVSTSAVFEQKSRLQKIDLKIQQQLKKEQQIQKMKRDNQRKKSETPSLGEKKFDQKPSSCDKKCTSTLVAKQTNKEPSKISSNQNKLLENPLIPPLPSKNKQQIIKVKMQQPLIQPKVYESNKEKKVKGLIKSKGFSKELLEENCFANKIQERKNFDSKRKSVENVAKPVLFGLDEEEKEKQEVTKNDGKKISFPFNCQSSQYHSERNIKASLQSPDNNLQVQQKIEPERYLFRKKQQIQVSSSVHSRVRKGSSSNNGLSRNAKNAYKLNEVTKQDEDVVINLPNSLGQNDENSSDDQMGDHENEIKLNQNFELKDINNSKVLQKYEQIINSSRSFLNKDSHFNFQILKQLGEQLQKPQVSSLVKQPNKKQNPVTANVSKNLNDYKERQSNEKNYIPQLRVNDNQINQMLLSFNQRPQQLGEDAIPENESLAFKISACEDNENDQILDESEQKIVCEQKEILDEDPNRIEEEIYEINNYYLSDNDANDNTENQQSIDPQTHPYRTEHNDSTNENQWSFDEEPELPMLQDKQSPFFEEANPYLVAQEEEPSIQSKKKFLQIRLQQNIKREDELNKLMQIKIDECKNAVPKYFEEILDFFRKKINKQDQYTENDERQVDEFLRKKGLTDQRKFQNFYKIMHFEMELQNTRKIIQRVCKNLSELDDAQEFE